MADGQEAPYIEGGGEHNQTPRCCSACLVFHLYVDICHSPYLLAGTSHSPGHIVHQCIVCKLYESVFAAQEKAFMELTQQTTQLSHSSAKMLTS